MTFSPKSKLYAWNYLINASKSIEVNQQLHHNQLMEFPIWSSNPNNNFKSTYIFEMIISISLLLFTYYYFFLSTDIVRASVFGTGGELIRLPSCFGAPVSETANKCRKDVHEKKRNERCFNVIQKVFFLLFLLCRLVFAHSCTFISYIFLFWWEQFTICYEIEIASVYANIGTERANRRGRRKVSISSSSSSSSTSFSPHFIIFIHIRNEHSTHHFHPLHGSPIINLKLLAKAKNMK